MQEINFILKQTTESDFTFIPWIFNKASKQESLEVEFHAWAIVG